MPGDISIKKMTRAIGAEVRGIDLSAPLDAPTVRTIREALVDNLVLFFRDQRKLSVDEHVRFAHYFGEIDLPLFRTKSSERPEVLVLDQVAPKGEGADSWHTDNTYMETPPMGSILQARMLPEFGGDTCFASMVAAYDALSPAMQRFLEGLTATHSLEQMVERTKHVAGASLRDSLDQWPPVIHPVVAIHPESGRKLLNVNANWTARIEGLKPEESETLLGFLLDHVKSPEFQVRLHWNVGDVAFWDNRAVQHYAVADYTARRVMQRVTISEASGRSGRTARTRRRHGDRNRLQSAGAAPQVSAVRKPGGRCGRGKTLRAGAVTMTRLQTRLAIAVMLTGTTFMSLVVTVLSPVLHDVAAHFNDGGNGAKIAQLIMTVPSIGIIVGGPISGWFVERMSIRTFLLPVLLIFGLAGSAGLYLDSIGILLATRFILGFAGAGVVTATLYMISEFSSAEDRARILGYQSAVGAIGAFAFVLLAGQLADFSWLARAVRPLSSGHSADRRRGIVRARQKAARAPTPGRGVVARAAGAVAGLPVDRADVHHLLYAQRPRPHSCWRRTAVARPSTQAWAIGIGGGALAIGATFYGPIRLRLGERRTLALCLAFMSAGLLISGLLHGVVAIALGFGIMGIGTGLANPHMSNMLLGRAAPEARGRAVGFGYTARYVGDFLNPVVILPLAGMVGIHTAFILVGAAARRLSGMLVALAGRRHAVATV